LWCVCVVWCVCGVCVCVVCVCGVVCVCVCVCVCGVVCVCMCVCVCVWCVLKPDLAISAEVPCRRVETSQVRKVRLKWNIEHLIATSSRRHGTACGQSEHYNALRGYKIHSRSYLASLNQMWRLLGTKVPRTLGWTNTESTYIVTISFGVYLVLWLF